MTVRAWIWIAVATACTADEPAGETDAATSGVDASSSGSGPTPSTSSSAGETTDAATSTSSSAASSDDSTSSGDASADGSGPGPTGSPGCGAEPPANGRYTIDVDGVEREYVLDVPDDYDPEHPYRLVFGWHWLGGVADDVVNGVFGGPYYGLESLAEGSAIFVAPEGIDNGWANPQGRDIAFALAIVDRSRDELCIDDARIFSTGFSYGGMMSNAIGCSLAGTFRAIAPLSGSLWSGCEPGDAPIAVWGAHGTGDDVVEIAAGRMARDEFLTRNGCGSESVPDGPCTVYQGCAAEHPVVWCEFEGGHAPPSFAPESTWAFFASL